MNPIQSVQALGQSLWLDSIHRDWLDSGDLANRVAAGELRGVTSNPTIFEKAILSSDSYQVDLRRFAQAGWTAERIYDQIAIDDIRTAADVFLPLFEQTNGRDGFVSIEVNPEYADDATRTVEEASRLWDVINRPNVMIKIPATLACLTAIEAVIRKGINVNATLIFSLERYIEIMEAYMVGLERRLEDGGSLDHVNAVASFFVSRIDTLLDEKLQEVIQRGGAEGERASSLLGKIAIASSKLAYGQCIAMFQGERFEHLAAHGAQLQRPLWASTSTKNPDYPDTYYVDQLIGPDTVNTLPETTLQAFVDHGTAELTLTENISTARSRLQALDNLGISLAEAADQLEREGVRKFVESQRSILRTIEEKAGVFREELAPLEPQLSETLAEVDRDGVGKRLWQEDVTLWAERDREEALLRRWLGWLAEPVKMATEVDALVRLAEECISSEMNTIVLLGSTCGIFTADMLTRVLNPPDDFVFHTLCSANPDDVRAITRKVIPEETLYLVIDSLSDDGLQEYTRTVIWEQTSGILGERATDHFVILTSGDSPLKSWAVEQGISKIVDVGLAEDPWYFPFNPVNLFAPALAGADLHSFVRGGVKMTRSCGPLADVGQNPGLFLGSVLAAASRSGRDKLSLFADPPLEPVLKWIEGLIAAGRGRRESGFITAEGGFSRIGTGLSDDCLVFYLRGTGKLDPKLSEWSRAGIPVVVIETSTSAGAIGELLVQLQIGAAVAQHLLAINPTDLDGMRRSRTAYKQIVQRLERKGQLASVDPLWQGDGMQVRAASRGLRLTGGGMPEVVDLILHGSQDAGGLGMRFYASMSQALQGKVERLRRALDNQPGLFSLTGFSACDVFPDQAIKDLLSVILMVKPRKDMPIPGKAFTLGQLYEGQARRDFAVLKDMGSPVIFLYFDTQKRLNEILLAMTKDAKARRA